MSFLKFMRLAPRRVLLLVIRLYQRTLSLDHGPMKHAYRYGFCKFHPSCSEYSYEAIERYGAVRGGVKALWRIVRCNPWNSGGIDRVA